MTKTIIRMNRREFQPYRVKVVDSENSIQAGGGPDFIMAGSPRGDEEGEVVVLLDVKDATRLGLGTPLDFAAI